MIDAILISALVLATCYIGAKIVAREWFRAKHRYMQKVMNDCMQPNTEES